MITYKKGISLIMLVITVIVLAILASTVIINLSNTNIINEADKTVFKSDMASYKELYSIYLADKLIEGISKQINHISIYVKRLLEVMENGVTYTTNELMELLDMKSRASFRENYLMPAINNGVVKMSFPDNPTNKNQTYYKY